MTVQPCEKFDNLAFIHCRKKDSSRLYYISICLDSDIARVEYWGAERLGGEITNHLRGPGACSAGKFFYF